MPGAAKVGSPARILICAVYKKLDQQLKGIGEQFRRNDCLVLERLGSVPPTNNTSSRGSHAIVQFPFPWPHTPGGVQLVHLGINL